MQGTETVEGLIFKPQITDTVCFSTNSFKEMKKLRLLQLDCVNLIGDYGCVSNQLRWIKWQGSTFNYIPDDFYQGNLVAMDLKHSSIRQVWNETKVMILTFSFETKMFMTKVIVANIFFFNFYLKLLSCCSCWRSLKFLILAILGT
jgi:hypothetical protein